MGERHDVVQLDPRVPQRRDDPAELVDNQSFHLLIDRAAISTRVGRPGSDVIDRAQLG